MINKKNLWFLTLFSLILVLSVYYITMPSEMLLTTNSSYVKKEEKTPKEKTVKTSIEESEVITALKVANEEKLDEELDSLKLVLNDTKSSTEEKNTAFEKMKNINQNKTKEEEIEKKLKEEFKYETFIKIEENKIKIVVDCNKHDKTLANNIMRSVQSNFENQMIITVEFKA